MRHALGANAPAKPAGRAPGPRHDTGENTGDSRQYSAVIGSRSNGSRTRINTWSSAHSVASRSKWQK